MVKELDSADLRRVCDPAAFHFETTDDLEPLDRIIGQERAIEALKLGLGIQDAKNRYNIYVAGDPGTGKMSAVEHFLSRLSQDSPQAPGPLLRPQLRQPVQPELPGVARWHGLSASRGHEASDRAPAPRDPQGL